MHESLFWIYLANSVLLITHEIDSAYWKEWKLFKLPGGITGFLLLHLPLLFLILYGLVQVFQETCGGLIFSLFLSASGLFAFAVHTMFIRKGRSEFNVPMSLFLLIAILLISLIQTVITVYLLIV
jgi:membrane protein CcdC involved in cytochrome C biogenesis